MMVMMVRLFDPVARMSSSMTMLAVMMMINVPVFLVIT
jgi:hypothetical protein